jgi:hypothetical protein
MLGILGRYSKIYAARRISKLKGIVGILRALRSPATNLVSFETG